MAFSVIYYNLTVLAESGTGAVHEFLDQKLQKSFKLWSEFCQGGTSKSGQAQHLI